MENCQFHEFSGSPVVLQTTYEKNMTSKWEVFFLSGKGDKRLIDILEGIGKEKCLRLAMSVDSSPAVYVLVDKMTL